MTDRISRLAAALAGRYRSERSLTDPKVTARTELFSMADYPIANPHADFDVLPDARFLMAGQPAITSPVMIETWPAPSRRLPTAVGRP